jgi:hypothetical protein
MFARGGAAQRTTLTAHKMGRHRTGQSWKNSSASEHRYRDRGIIGVLPTHRSCDGSMRRNNCDHRSVRITYPTLEHMNNGITDPVRTSSSRVQTNEEELSRLKRELMKAEVRLAKARATVVTAEIDVKALLGKLKNFAA